MDGTETVARQSLVPVNLCPYKIIIMSSSHQHGCIPFHQVQGEPLEEVTYGYRLVLPCLPSQGTAQLLQLLDCDPVHPPQRLHSHRDEHKASAAPWTFLSNAFWRQLPASVAAPPTLDWQSELDTVTSSAPSFPSLQRGISTSVGLAAVPGRRKRP